MNYPEFPSKPTWEYGGTFDAAWHALTDCALMLTDRFDREGDLADHDLAGQMTRVLFLMAKAHVVTIDTEQVEALPSDPDVFLDYEPDPHLPFPILYVSTGTSELAGVLMATNTDEQMAVIPFLGPGSIGLAYPVTLLDTNERTVSEWLKVPLREHYDDDDHQVALHTTERALAVMRFLESANVDFEDTPVSRQVRRQAGRKGTPIAQRVYVRAPRHRRTDGGRTEHGRIDYSHRFEVRGHYKHFGSDTRLFRATERDRPHKVIQHPKLGPVVRIWCPDFVKGPIDQPLIIKTRVHKKQSDEDQEAA